MAMMEDEGGTAEDLLTAISFSGLHGCGNFGVDVPLHLRLPDALTRPHRSRDAYHYWHVFASDDETEVMSDVSPKGQIQKSNTAEESSQNVRKTMWGALSKSRVYETRPG